MAHIGIDARLYGIASGTGIGRYTEELLRQFREFPIPNSQFPTIRYTVFLRRDTYQSFELPNERWKKVLADFRPYSVAAQVGFPEVIRRAGVDVMHFTHFDHPLAYRAPFVVTIHDLILLSHPSVRASTLGPLRYWGKHAAYQRVISHAVHGSMRILTPSQAVKDDVAGRFDVMREKIVPTLLGVDHADARHCESANGSPLASEQGELEGVHDSARKQLHPQQSVEACEIATSQTPRNDDNLIVRSNPYLLYIGNCYPHKNVEQLIRVMPTLCERHPDLHLVIIGREDDFQKRLNTNRVRSQIMFTGAVREEDRVALLTHAVAYVSASAAEGFDIPTIEALAAGTPVIASDIPVHRELLREHATYFPVGDDRTLIDVIHRHLASSNHRAPATIEEWKRHAASYTWRRCASQTLAVYREVATLITQRSGAHATKDHHARQKAGTDVRTS